MSLGCDLASGIAHNKRAEVTLRGVAHGGLDANIRGDATHNQMAYVLGCEDRI